MRDEMVRRLIADAVQRVLEEGMLQAADPAEYLRIAAEDVRRVVALCDAEHPGEGSELRGMVAEEVTAAARTLLGCLQH